MAFKSDKAQAEVLTVEQSDRVSDVVRADDAKLAELGYRSEFRREFSVRQILHPLLLIGSFLLRKRFETVAFAISIMGVIASVTSTFSFGLFNGLNISLLYGCHVEPLNFSIGGHVGLVFGWLIPCCFVAFVALSMAEMASSMPYVFTHNSPIITNDDVERALAFTISLQKWLLQSMQL